MKSPATTAAILGLAIAAAACSQGNSDNVMSPDGNALTPAEVNAALGPEVTNTPGPIANDTNATDAAGGNSPGTTESATNNVTQ